MTTNTKHPNPDENPKYQDPLWDRAEQYVLEEMTDAERQVFEHDMASNPALATAVDEIRHSILAVRAGAMREELDDIHRRASVFSKSKFKFRPGIAAGFLLLLALSFWLLTRPSHNEKYFAEYATTDPGLPVPMSATDDYNFYDAMVDYKSEDYNSAIHKWQTQFIENPRNDTLAYYLASSYFNIKDYPLALTYYQEVAPESVFYARSQWYRALIHLKYDDKAALDAIVPDTHSAYADKIRELQSLLD